MIQKRDNCLYCGGKMESVTAKKKFCSDKCKVYWNREKAFEKKLDKILTPFQKEAKKVVQDIREIGMAIYDNNGNHIPIESELGQKIINQASEKPEKLKGESGIDYAIRLAEWKEKQK